MKSSVLWVITPCSPLKADVSEEHVASIFKSEEQAKQESSMKISADFQRTTRRYIPEDRTLRLLNLPELFY
jgi:hypothetical protein